MCTVSNTLVVTTNKVCTAPFPVNLGSTTTFQSLRQYIEGMKFRFLAVCVRNMYVSLFPELLQVSAFSTWDKELPKFVFDPRYLLLNPKERREVFDEFVREHAEEEMREKKAKLKEKKERFVKLMEESKITTR